uniref:Uncharacterized protein n=1 Tax=Cacopsylla melanoneura TaxID=428564 RepID=A0A8D8Z4N9_9HEMI
MIRSLLYLLIKYNILYHEYGLSSIQRSLFQDGKEVPEVSQTSPVRFNQTNNSNNTKKETGTRPESNSPFLEYREQQSKSNTRYEPSLDSYQNDLNQLKYNDHYFSSYCVYFSRWSFRVGCSRFMKHFWR